MEGRMKERRKKKKSKVYSFSGNHWKGETVKGSQNGKEGKTEGKKKGRKEKERRFTRFQGSQWESSERLSKRRERKASIGSERRWRCQRKRGTGKPRFRFPLAALRKSAKDVWRERVKMCTKYRNSFSFVVFSSLSGLSDSCARQINPTCLKKSGKKHVRKNICFLFLFLFFLLSLDRQTRVLYGQAATTTTSILIFIPVSWCFFLSSLA